jgi:mannosyltransferase PIG-V
VSRARILLPFLVTRGTLILVGLLAMNMLMSGLTLQKGNLVYHRAGPAVLEMWARWDAEWYLLVAEQGYRSEAHFLGLPVRYHVGDTTGFFPLYPLLIRAATLLGLSSLLAGVLVSNAALLTALAFLKNLARRDFGEEEAEAAVWVLLAFPTSLFLSAVYAESLMLACLLGSLWAVRAGRPWLAGVLAGLCVLSRPTGILVLIPLFDELIIEPWARRDPAKGSTLRRFGPLFPPLAALAGYAAYCHSLFGSYAAFLLRQERWRGPSSGPWRAFQRYLESPGSHDVHHSAIDLAFALLFVGSIPFLFLRLRRSYALYATAAILLPLCSTLWSFRRFAATVFPFHLLVAIVTVRSRGTFAAYLAVGLPLLGFFMALYAAWWWAG